MATLSSRSLNWLATSSYAACRLLSNGCAPGDNNDQNTNDQHGERQQLAHREPVEGDEAQLAVRLAHELHGEAECAVPQQEQPGDGHGGPAL